MKFKLLNEYFQKESTIPTFLIGILLFLNIFSLINSVINPDNSSKSINNIENQIQSQNKQIQAISAQSAALKKSLDKLNNDLIKETSFKEALNFTLGFEGGLSNDAADTGGLTNLGITHTEYAEYRAKKKLPRRSVSLISLAEALDIYRNSYWINSGCGNLQRRVAIACFDWQVNSGRGVTTLQQVLGIGADGVIGPLTMNELNSWENLNQEDKLLHNYFERREADYRRWGVGSQSVFLTGWLRRAEALKSELKVA
jgi:cell division protein FtsB